MGGEGAGEGISTKIGAGGHGCNSRDGVEEKEARKEGERVSQMLRSGSGGDPPSKLCGRKTTVGCCRHDNSQSHLEHAAPAQLFVKISLVKWQGGPCFGCYLSSP